MTVPRGKKHTKYIYPTPVDYSQFSGKSWKQLEDIWPRDLRVSSEAWKIVSVMYPAWIQTKMFCGENLGMQVKRSRGKDSNKNTFVFRDLLILAWMQRCEEARENVAFEHLPVVLGMHSFKSVLNPIKARLIRLDLVENLPTNRKLCRVTEKGKVILRYFVEQLEQAHYNLRKWMSDIPDETAEYVDKYLVNYCFNYADLFPDKKEGGSQEPTQD